MGQLSASWINKYAHPTTMNNSQSPSPPAPTSDPDAPLNLTKPKSESFSSNSSANSTPRWNDGLLSANTPVDASNKTYHPSLMRPPFLPYPNLSHHSSGRCEVIDVILCTSNTKM